MTTPRKNFNYNSPYARPVQQYPSQCEDYISLDMGGLKQSNNIEKTPGHYSGGKYYQQNYRKSNIKANQRNLFSNNYTPSQNNNRQQNYNQQQSRYTPQHQNYRKSPGGSGGKQQKQNPHNNRLSDRSINVASYVHPSMTEDPWFELMQRMQSLKSSEINITTKSAKETTSPLHHESSTHTDSDNSKDEDNESEAALSD